MDLLSTGVIFRLQAGEKWKESRYDILQQLNMIFEVVILLSRSVALMLDMFPT